jgi:Zn-dependent protease
VPQRRYSEGMSSDEWHRAPTAWEPADRPHQPPPEPEFQSPVHRERSIFQRIGGAIVAAALAVAKFGGLIFGVLFKFKFAISFLISAGAYALVWGWRFGLGFVLLLLVHEMGHVIQLRREGVPASAPMFIPFLGAVVAMRGLPENAYVEAKVGLAGPVLGSVGAFGTLLLAEQTNSDLLRALAYTGCLLNLFNLVPVVPLDGGRAAAALHPAFWGLGLVLLAGLAVLYRNPFIFVVLAFVAFEVYRRWQGRGSLQSQAYHAVTAGQRALVFAVYMGLVVALVVGMHAAHVTVQR